MKTLSLSLTLAISVCLLQLFSCSKTIETPNNSVSVATSDNLSFPTTNEFAGCKLRRIYQSYGPGNAMISGLFTYNGQGNPFSVLYDNDDIANDHFFTYDNQGRLKEYRSTGSFYGTERHVYGYDANKTIITDTFHYGIGDFVFQTFISTFTYDAQGRIVKENIRNTRNIDTYSHPQPLLPTRNPTYTYDSRGNLGVTGWKSSSYDYKPSIFRTHPLFQFIHRNYSVNNSSVQPKYNSKGLPLSVVPGNDGFFNLPNVTKAIYDCP